MIDLINSKKEKMRQLVKIEKMLNDFSTKLEGLKKHFQINKVYSNNEFCEYLGISKRTAQKFRAQELIKFTQQGGKIFYQQKNIDEFLETFATESKYSKN